MAPDTNGPRFARAALMGRKKQPEYASCEFCKARFRKRRDWQRFCSTSCSDKARRAKAMPGILPGIQLPSMPECPSGAAGGENALHLPREQGISKEGVARESRLLVYGPNGRRWGRNPKQIEVEDLEAEGHKPMPPLAVMRAMCLDCRPADEVLVCARPHCPLWPYRLGANPWRQRDAQNLRRGC